MGRSTKSSMSTSRNASSMTCRCAPSPGPHGGRCGSRPSATTSLTRTSGRPRASCSTKANCFARSRKGHCFSGRPLSSMFPLAGRRSPASRRSSVDLPDPLGPITARNSWGMHARQTESRMRCLPASKQSPVALRNGCCLLMTRLRTGSAVVRAAGGRPGPRRGLSRRSAVPPSVPPWHAPQRRPRS